MRTSVGPAHVSLSLKNSRPMVEQCSLKKQKKKHWWSNAVLRFKCQQLSSPRSQRNGLFCFFFFFSPKLISPSPSSNKPPRDSPPALSSRPSALGSPSRARVPDGLPVEQPVGQAGAPAAHGARAAALRLPAHRRPHQDVGAGV